MNQFRGNVGIFPSVVCCGSDAEVMSRDMISISLPLAYFDELMLCLARFNR